jgi:CcmD family protein
MSTNLTILAVIATIVWVGLFAYLLMLDRKVAALESRRREDDL